MDELELELDDNHIYTLGGVRIPGVTHVLQKMGATPNFSFMEPSELEWYQNRGRAVHKMIELFVKGVLDRRTISKELKPYLIGWERFTKEYDVTDIQIQHVENPIHHPAFRYGCTPDIVARVKGQMVPIELKATSQHSPATELQTAAQALALAPLIPGIEQNPRWAVRLLQEEPYFDPREYTDRSHKAVWLSLLNSYSWLTKYKMIREKRS